MSPSFPLNGFDFPIKFKNFPWTYLVGDRKMVVASTELFVKLNSGWRIRSTKQSERSHACSQKWPLLPQFLYLHFISAVPPPLAFSLESTSPCQMTGGGGSLPQLALPLRPPPNKLTKTPCNTESSEILTFWSVKSSTELYLPFSSFCWNTLPFVFPFSSNYESNCRLCLTICLAVFALAGFVFKISIGLYIYIKRRNWIHVLVDWFIIILLLLALYTCKQISLSLIWSIDVLDDIWRTKYGEGISWYTELCIRTWYQYSGHGRGCKFCCIVSTAYTYVYLKMCLEYKENFISTAWICLFLGWIKNIFPWVIIIEQIMFYCILLICGGEYESKALSWTNFPTWFHYTKMYFLSVKDTVNFNTISFPVLSTYLFLLKSFASYEFQILLL